MKLSAAQQTAVEREGQDVCVVAGPGSGKTRVLVERYAWLVRQQKHRPSRLLAITFTEKAANELKERLAKEFSGDAELRRQLERAPISTIHSFAKRLLGEHAVAAGLDPRFAMLDEDDARQIEGEAISAVLNRWAAQRETKLLALMSSWAVGDAPADLRAAMETIRTSGLPREQWLVEPDPSLTFAAFQKAAAALLSLRHYATTEKQQQCFTDLEAWLARDDDEWTLLAEFQLVQPAAVREEEGSERARKGAP
ncbi:MAG: UvrD-helicase domain-containing protein [Bryobacter sp.]|nr:UvrD-helicase domain-containing protein [Bryobacter sp.]